MATVVNKRTSPYDVYIGRGSIWGNPFRIGPDGTRADVIRKFTDYAQAKYDSGEWTDDMIKQLKGKRLACYCAPLACHGDVLAKAANSL